jgi:hypothetical protein
LGDPKSFFEAMFSALVSGLEVLEPTLEGDDDSEGMLAFGIGGKVVFELPGTGDSKGEYGGSSNATACGYL